MYNTLVLLVSLVIGGINYKMYNYVGVNNFALMIYGFGMYVLIGIMAIMFYGHYMRIKSNQLTKKGIRHSVAMDKLYKMDKTFEVICMFFIVSSVIVVLIGIIEETIKK